MHDRDTIEPARSPPFANSSKPVAIDVVGVAHAVAQIDWVEEVAPPPALRLVIGGAQLPEVNGVQPRIAAGRADEAPNVTETRKNEGGSSDVEPSAVLRLVT